MTTTITTATELDALPVGSVVLGAGGHPLLRVEGGRAVMFGSEGSVPWKALRLPLTTLHVPGQPAPAVKPGREELWGAIVAVRDAWPRVPNDAPTDDIVDAILALPGKTEAEVWREAADWIEGVDLGGQEHPASSVLSARADELERGEGR